MALKEGGMPHFLQSCLIWLRGKPNLPPSQETRWVRDSGIAIGLCPCEERLQIWPPLPQVCPDSKEIMDFLGTSLEVSYPGAWPQGPQVSPGEICKAAVGNLVAARWLFMS